MVIITSRDNNNCFDQQETIILIPHITKLRCNIFYIPGGTALNILIKILNILIKIFTMIDLQKVQLIRAGPRLENTKYLKDNSA